MIIFQREKIIIIFSGFVLFFMIIGLNLFRIQYVQSTFFTKLAEDQYSMCLKLAPPRGELFDRHGTLLAINKECESAFITPCNIKDKKNLKRFLKKHFPSAHERLTTHEKSRFMFIKRKLNIEEKKIIADAHLEDIYFLQEAARAYPHSCSTLITGTTNIDNNGLFGIELSYNNYLAGEPTYYSLEKEARTGYFIKKEIAREGKTSKSIRLTLDNNLQFLAHQELHETATALHAQEGAVLIMDPDTGDILTMTQFPDCDPDHIDAIETTKNIITSNVYEFGSVMKIFPALAAFEEDVVTPDELIDCENTKTTFIKGMRINTWKPHGILTYAEVIQNSNNIGTSKVSARLGNTLYDHYRRCGFGQKTNITLPGEVSGFVNPPHLWSTASIFSLSFGYEVNATLLQLASAVSMIANGGHFIKPRITFQEPIQKSTDTVYSKATLTTIKKILTDTITYGTAHQAAIEGYTVWGKTGTANLLEDGVYNPDKNIFTFVMVIEKNNYKRVVVTFIKEILQKNVFASTIAAPLAEKISKKMLIHDKII